MHTIGKVNFMGFECAVQKTYYGNNKRTALQLFDVTDGQPVATATVNIPEVELKENEVLIKNYSENEGMLEALERAGIVWRTGESVSNGRVTIPVAKLLKGIS